MDIAPDYEAIARRLIAENERLRVDIKNLRTTVWEEVAYYWQQGIEALDEPKYQVLLMVSVPIVLTLVRGLVKHLRRKKHEG